MLSLGYDLLTHRFELVALQTDDIVPRGDSTLRVTVRRSKADPFSMGGISFTSRQTAVHLAKWLAWRGPDIVPLFCGIYQKISARWGDLRQAPNQRRDAPWYELPWVTCSLGQDASHQVSNKDLGAFG